MKLHGNLEYDPEVVIISEMRVLLEFHNQTDPICNGKKFVLKERLDDF